MIKKSLSRAIHFSPFSRGWIALRSSRWTIPLLFALPYLGSIAWLVSKGQTWIGLVMLSPALMLTLLILLTWILAQLEFQGRWHG